MTEIFVERALARAKEVDDYLQNTGKTMGPLHGLPISIKDQFSMKGLETIMGMLDFPRVSCNLNTEVMFRRICIVDRKLFRARCCLSGNLI